MDKIDFKISDNIRDGMDAIKKKSDILLLGVTGGIASGKSTVANLLKAMGAPNIDFDILARQVVEPEKPAWQDIVNLFGKEILYDDGNIDRKRLSSIVFRDPEKRRKLEEFTHPRIYREFLKQVDEIASKDTEAIIQAVIPLLIEVGMQDLFHKIIVVHIPREKQIERLMERDGISKVESIDILNAQMHIDEKVRWADFVIRNENSIEKTIMQVEDLWKKLRELQKSGNNRD
ncbi:dephospho-CoA kinase [Thermodesulfobacteriota bacterium]